MSTRISSLSIRTTVPSTTSPCLKLLMSESCSASSSSIVVGSGPSSRGGAGGSGVGQLQNRPRRRVLRSVSRPGGLGGGFGGSDGGSLYLGGGLRWRSQTAASRPCHWARSRSRPRRSRSRRSVSRCVRCRGLVGVRGRRLRASAVVASAVAAGVSVGVARTWSLGARLVWVSASVRPRRARRRRRSPPGSVGRLAVHRRGCVRCRRGAALLLFGQWSGHSCRGFAPENHERPERCSGRVRGIVRVWSVVI